jgi:hypothetical protein
LIITVPVLYSAIEPGFFSGPHRKKKKLKPNGEPREGAHPPTGELKQKQKSKTAQLENLAISQKQVNYSQQVTSTRKSTS